jgi:FSR family fosmidomycin resistance protein-like MFS transporter
MGHMRDQGAETGVVPVLGPASQIARPDTRILALLALGHMVVDINQGSLAPLLPFLKTRFALSYTAAGAILLVSSLTSSLIQPVFGYLSDRRARRWLLPWGLVFASVGVAFTGWAPSYPALLTLVVVSGLGVAAYHPEGSSASRSAPAASG